MNIKHCFFALLCIVQFFAVNGQETGNYRPLNVYRPNRTESPDTIRKPAVPGDRAVPVAGADGINQSQDSITAREIFVRDSLLARQQFVRDSIERRKKILDSINILKPKLERVLQAYSRTIREDIILKYMPIPVIGDSMLGDFVYQTLPFGVREPYCPWKVSIKLTGKSVNITPDKSGKQIAAVHTSQLKASFADAGNLLIITKPATTQKDNRGSFYKIPVDSVFYDRSGRIVKIKSYVQFYLLTSSNQKGQLLFTNATFAKQYQYNAAGQLTTYQLVRFYERWKAYEPNKVSSIIDYVITRTGNEIQVTQKNDPANPYAEGAYTFTLSTGGDLSGITFINAGKTDGWQRDIELNKNGNVSCYIDKKNGLITQSLCMIYHTESGSKYPVEQIITTFEKDGISYLQRNNTTGKSRTRDRMTLEWSVWK